MKVRLASLVLALLTVTGAQAADILQAPSEPVRFDPAASAKREQWRAPGQLKVAATALNLPPLAAERISAMQRRNQAAQHRRVQIGISRSVASESLDDLPRPAWQYVAGGAVLNLDVVSPGAAALRVGIRAGNWPAGAELRVAGSVFADEIYATAGSAARLQASADGVFWTAVTDGERQHLELFVPAGIDPATVALNVDAVSHIVVPQQGGSGHGKALGDSDSCNVDVVCRFNTLGANFVAVKDAVARMVFQSGGGSYTCTGTLLNDTDANTQVPYFFTAHHCIGTQAEASSLTTFWRYETPVCGTDQNGPNTQLSGGSALLYSQASTDGALLRLNNTPPNGAVLAGWYAAALTPSTPITAIHHPSGDIKKVSQGNHSGFTANVTFGDGQVVTSAARASWSQGTTEGGSSGSGLFTDSSLLLRGGLYGGRASCANTGQSEAAGNVDYYSRLDLIFPSIQQYLTGASQPGATRDYTGQWDLPSEAGRGLSMFSFNQNQVLFALWFVYDGQGKAIWYQLDPQWTGVDVASGRVVSWTGSPWGPNYNPDARVLTQVGTFTLTFTSATQATFSYNVAGVNRTIQLTRL
jgi:lysyl endopeptidase